MKDYRQSHLGDKSRRYEEEIYRAGSYDDAIWQIEKKILRREAERFSARKSDIAYLDFGCGGGRILRELEEYTARAVGVDTSPEMIERARERVKKATLVLADVTEYDPLQGEKFDLITAFRVFLNAGPELSHKIMLSLVPKLSSGGVFIFNFHGNIFSYRAITKLWLWLKGRSLNTISYPEARRFAERYNLKIARIYGVGFLPKIFYRIFGTSSMLAIDSLFAKIPLFKYISYNLILVCEHQS